MNLGGRGGGWGGVHISDPAEAEGYRCWMVTVTPQGTGGTATVARAIGSSVTLPWAPFVKNKKQIDPQTPRRNSGLCHVCTGGKQHKAQKENGLVRPPPRVASTRNSRGVAGGPCRESRGVTEPCSTPLPIKRGRRTPPRLVLQGSIRYVRRPMPRMPDSRRWMGTGRVAAMISSIRRANCTSNRELVVNRDWTRYSDGLPSSSWLSASSRRSGSGSVACGAGDGAGGERTRAPSPPGVGSRC